MIRKYISHAQDKYDAINELKGIGYPAMLVVEKMPPTKEHTEEYEKKRKQMAHFFRSVVTTFSRVAGISDEQARTELQLKFARCGEVIVEESGEYDVVWMDNDRLRVMEQGKMYYVHSVADMTNSELSTLIEKSKDFLLIQYGAEVPEIKRKIKTKEIRK